MIVAIYQLANGKHKVCSGVRWIQVENKVAQDHGKLKFWVEGEDLGAISKKINDWCKRQGIEEIIPQREE